MVVMKLASPLLDIHPEESSCKSAAAYEKAASSFATSLLVDPPGRFPLFVRLCADRRGSSWRRRSRAGVVDFFTTVDEAKDLVMFAVFCSLVI